MKQIEAENRLTSKIIIAKISEENRTILDSLNFINISQEFGVVSSSYLYKMTAEDKIDKEQIRKIQHHNISKIKSFGIIMFSILFFQFFFYYIQIFTINFASQHAMFDLRKDVFSVF